VSNDATQQVKREQDENDDDQNRDNGHGISFGGISPLTPDNERLALS
jgi:hypothetical protein